jgi:nitroreductase
MVLRNADEKARLRKLAWDQPKVSEAPVTLIVLADRNGWREGHPTVEKTWQSFIDTGQFTHDQRDWFLNGAESLYNWSTEADLAFAAKNTGFFAMALMFAATSMGFDTHPMDGFEHEKVRKAFNIPAHFWIPLLLAVGYRKPDLELLPAKWRKSYDEIVVEFTP